MEVLCPGGMSERMVCLARDVVCPGGGVSDRGDRCLSSGCLPGRVVCPGLGTCPGGMSGWSGSPVDTMTDACENITFPYTTYAVGKD